MARSGRRMTVAAMIAIFAMAHLARTASPEGSTARAGGGQPSPPALPPLATRMSAAVKKAHPGELRWQQIPWLVDPGEGIRQAKAENRPLLLWVSGDDPLEKC